MVDAREYRLLEIGEEIKAGDQFSSKHGSRYWLPAQLVGTKVTESNAGCYRRRKPVDVTAEEFRSVFKSERRVSFDWLSWYLIGVATGSCAGYLFGRIF